MGSSLFGLPFLCLLLQPFISSANLHKAKLLRSELLTEPASLDDSPSTLYFEVTKPIKLPNTKPCSYPILHHDFGYTYGKPPVLANYTPPSHCISHKLSKIVFEWKLLVKGDSLTAFLVFGLVALRFFGAVQQSQGLLGLFGLLKRTLQGGVNPLLWRPITGIGSFDLPSYDIEITPFLGKILERKTHKFGFNVTNAINVWYIDANLHLWLDSKSTQTEGKLLKHTSLPLVESLVSDFKGLNGNFLTGARRSILSTGWVKSAHGNITTRTIQDFNYRNTMVIGKNGNRQIVNQTIHFNDGVYSEVPSSYHHFIESNKTFLLYLNSDELDQGNGTYKSVSNLTLEYNEKKSKNGGFGFSNSSLKNVQNGQKDLVEAYTHFDRKIADCSYDWLMCNAKGGFFQTQMLHRFLLVQEPTGENLVELVGNSSEAQRLW
ncbi:Peptide-N4-(N-acetyl-beta-glucosaminyl)asparagine amidase A [Quillaja saponaria]|uniref:Peptide-N4-(N-acetyl-beta-glucosaminyl)asparagine amidase A n=1 Tax=Quillaja saponaria TaxID=32244 RepID=A0AAD7QI68_QUISA|nr:Peptide-N4-(N-acetyl-beta-glucosaminyl)asparagine amidase A [Quillaja saponaria]